MTDKGVPEYLYHYTTADGLKGIIEDCAIWASDIFSLNDTSEFTHGRDLFGKYLRKHLGTLRPEERLPHYDELATELEDKSPAELPAAYVCSFSGGGRGDDLNQWRAYCRADGFNIGFPRDRLRSLAWTAGIDIIDCVYREEKKKAFCQSLLTELDSQFFSPPAISIAHCIVNKCIVAFKDRVFQDEDECRLVWHDAMREPDERLLPEVRFRGGDIVRYVKFRLNNVELWKEAKIMVGPGRNQEKAKTYVMELLKTKLPEAYRLDSFDDHVTESKVPYRPV